LTLDHREGIPQYGVIIIIIIIIQFFFFFFFFLYGAPAHIGPWPPLYEVP
jgi:hypothetical protein